MGLVNVIEFATAGDIDPDTVTDWTTLFHDAIAKAADEGHAGVLVPARAAPYEFHDVGANMSIDLRGRHDFVLKGEGPRSVLAMVGPGSWRLIHVGDASDVVIRDLCLDASRATKLDEHDDQLHLVVIGASINRPEGARRISILDCVLQDALSDGVAIAPESSANPRHEFSDIMIAGCHFLRNRRSGVSNQRFAKRVSILHNRFEGTKNADIDMEPSSGLADAGPSGYLILGNTMVRTGSSESVSLSGSSPESRSKVNTFAYNQILGGRLGVINAQDLAIVGNYIEIGPGVKGTVVRLSGAIERLLFADNNVVRPAEASTGTLLNLGSRETRFTLSAEDPLVIDVANDTITSPGHRLQTGTGPIRVSAPDDGTLPGGLQGGVDYWAIKVDDDHFQLNRNPPSALAPEAVDITSLGKKTFHVVRHAFPRTVNISRNHFSTFRPPEGEALITVTNASEVNFHDNDVASYVDGEIPVALKFESLHQVYKRQVAGWDVVGNSFRGNATVPPRFRDRPPGRFGTCVNMAAGHDTVGNVRVADNTFSGCLTQVLLHADTASEASPAGAFVRAPHVVGNIGDGAIALEGVPAILVGGNLGGGDVAGDRFCGLQPPTFAAPAGSLYSRTGPGAAERLWINTDGNTGWTALDG